MGNQFGKGSLSYGANFALDFNAAPLSAGLAWQVEQTPDYLRIFIPGGVEPTGPVVPGSYVANNLPLRAPLNALIGGSPMPHPDTLLYPNLDSTKTVDIAVYDPGYRDTDLAPSGMRGLLYEVAGGLFDTFSIDPAAGEFQGPFRLMMWNNNGWTLGAEGIVPNQTYDLSNYAGAQDKFVIMWDDPSRAPDLTVNGATNPNLVQLAQHAEVHRLQGDGEHVGDPSPGTGHAGVADLRRPGPVGLASASCRLTTPRRPS